MDTLPQEILDEVLTHIVDRHQPVTERFKTFTPASLHTVLACRLVARRWFESEVLVYIFAWVLSETPMVWYNHRLPVLEEISEIPKYASWFNQSITICGMDMSLVEYGAYERWGPGRDELDKENPIVPYLAHLLRRFSWVEHFRFYPIHPRCLNGSWPNWKVSKEERVPVDACFDDRTSPRYGYPVLAEGEYSWQGVQCESAWIYPHIMEGLLYSDLCLYSVESALFGNRASYCAISLPVSGSGFSPVEHFSYDLTRIAITCTNVAPISIFGTWMMDIENLEYVEITLSRSPKDEHHYYNLPLGGSHLMCGYRPEDEGKFLKKLKDFRFMSDCQYFYSVDDLLACLRPFSNLENVAFGHILLGEGDWSSLVQRLVPFKLKKLWLLDPRNLIITQRTYFPLETGAINSDVEMVKYVGDEHLLEAALEVRLIDTDSLWTSDQHPALRRDFEYPGFRIFEMEDDD